MQGGAIETDVVQTKSRELHLDTRIDSGNEGEVFGIKESKETVVKIFHPEYRNSKEDKIRAMIKTSNQPTPETPADDDFRSIVWPQEIVEDASTGEFLGYAMPREDLDTASNALLFALSDADWTNRLAAALNLAIMVDTIHQHGHAIGDFNEGNILIADGYIKLIDCDGFHIKDGIRVYSGETFKPRYSPPEGRPQKISDVRKADRFCLAIHIFQFLMDGEHPYRVPGKDGVPGNFRDKIKQNSFPYSDSSVSLPQDLQQKYDNLPQKIQEKFELCFEQGKSEESLRPRAEEWRDVLMDVAGLEREPQDRVRRTGSDRPHRWADKTKQEIITTGLPALIGVVGGMCSSLILGTSRTIAETTTLTGGIAALSFILVGFTPPVIEKTERLRSEIGLRSVWIVANFIGCYLILMKSDPVFLLSTTIFAIIGFLSVFVFRWAGLANHSLILPIWHLVLLLGAGILLTAVSQLTMSNERIAWEGMFPVSESLVIIIIAMIVISLIGLHQVLIDEREQYF